MGVGLICKFVVQLLGRLHSGSTLLTEFLAFPGVQLFAVSTTLKTYFYITYDISNHNSCHHPHHMGHGPQSQKQL